MKQLLLYTFLILGSCKAFAQNVGIGTTTPQRKLHVHGDNSLYTAVQISNNVSGQSINNGMMIGFQYQGLGTFNNYGLIQVTSPETNLAFGTNGRFSDLVIFSGGNVGIGTNSGDASAILYLNSTTSGLRLPNLTSAQRTGIAFPAEGLVVYDTDLKALAYRASGKWQTIDSANSYWQRAGFGNMKSILPKVLINTNPFLNGEDFSLTVGGAAAIFNTTGGASRQAALVIADTLTTSTLPSGISIQKITANGTKNFVSLSVDGTRPLVKLQAALKNGTAQGTFPEVVFDSTGFIGIGDFIDAKRIRSNLHVFGNHNVEGITGGTTMFLHGPENNYTLGSELRFQYSGTGNTANNGGLSRAWYTLTHQSKVNGLTDTYDCLTLGRTTVVPILGTTEFVGMVYNDNGQVGIRKYPEKALSGDIKVDILGNTRIAGGLQLTGIGEATGKLLVSNATGEANWQNPPKVTLDQTSATGQSVVEFRNQGVYVGGFGWSQASSRYFLYDGATNTNPLLIKNGLIGIQREATTNALEVNGNASKSTAGSWLGNSDARLKINMQPIESSLEKLLQLKGITYTWNDDKTGYKRPEGVQYGFTAQNIQQVFPEMVTTDAQGYLQTAYGTYDPLIIEALRELKKENEELKREIENIKALIKK